MHVVAQPTPADAGVPDAPAPPRLACDPGTTIASAPAPEPTWFCARGTGVRHGPFVTLFPDGSTAIAGTYKDGKLDGAWQRHYPSGELDEDGTYANGVKDGPWRQLGPSGTVLGTYTMKAGTGVEKRWYDDGPLYSERALRAGVPQGWFKIYDHDGQIAVSARFYRGRLDGPHVVGAKNTLRIEERFSNGVRHDARKIWQFWLLVMEENYDHRGKLDGAFTIWRDRKVPRVQGTYDHGKRIGTWSWFDRNNNKEREGDFADGKKTGAWFEWTENKLTFSGSFTDGKPDGEFVYYDKAGNELGRFEIKDGTGTMMTFYANHRPATKAHYVQGKLDGLYQELTWHGKKVEEGRYASNRKHGWWRDWTELGVLTLEEHYRWGKLDGTVKKYDDGKLATEATYKSGKAEGKYTEYRNGKPALTGQFTDDRRTGTWTTYAADGTVVLTASYKNGVLDGPWRQLAGGVVYEGPMVAGRRSGTWTRTDRTGASQVLTYRTP
jgi:uncharacterized protein